MTGTIIAIGRRPDAWAILARGLAERRPVRARYQGTDRLLCPHVLGWHNARPKVLSYQSAGETSHGPLPTDRRLRWRSMFVDEIEDAVLTDEPWESADNYIHYDTGINVVELRVETAKERVRH
jgi:hypothetical protein